MTLACDDEQIQAHEAAIPLGLRRQVKMTSMVLLPVVMSRFGLTTIYLVVWFLILIVYFLLRCSYSSYCLSLEMLYSSFLLESEGALTVVTA